MAIVKVFLATQIDDRHPHIAVAIAIAIAFDHIESGILYKVNEFMRYRTRSMSIELPCQIVRILVD